ncbi:aminotransferase class I/II-fold pyridoxal phosphate-dependent enzyme [Fictibacillus sp. B-59209]|uniref:trans-sulfuration enzyme family protein n=1 Tax=Fictibacillus sp. B-59209 TaxID=3024873 RepID=UPI002E22CF62|nr:aminotransferase class I/II-fold pyridoxal phosphate-dependent enzyme [Fictibacillus sp. B-59209]
MKDKKFDTKAVHFSTIRESEVASKVQPIYQTTAYSFKDLDDIEDYFRGNKPYLYSRVDNPNNDDLATGVARLEGAPSGAATSSGLSAILCAVLAVAQSGDHIVACDDLYGGTYHLFASELKTFGIEVTFVPFADQQSIQEAIQPNTKILYSESITNPLLRVEDIHGIAELAKKNKVISMIDNTFATPYLLQPYVQGVNVVIHSATKYIAGHSDVTAGIIAGDQDIVQKAKEKMANLGCNLGPFDAWLAARGLKTLSVRMERQVKNAAWLAEVLKEHPAIKKVYYPESVSMQGNGAIVTAELSDDADIEGFFRHLSWVKIVATLAGVETSVSYPLGTSHRAMPDELIKRLGITKHVVRISVGIEDKGDITEVFQNALNHAL